MVPFRSLSETQEFDRKTAEQEREQNRQRQKDGKKEFANQ